MTREPLACPECTFDLSAEYDGDKVMIYCLNCDAVWDSDGYPHE